MTATHDKPDTALKPSALAGVRLLDFTRNQQGPFATLRLCDMGAEVIKVEPPGGEPGRASGLMPDGFSSYFEGHNRGKKSITLDFKRPGALDVVKRLIPTVDVVVENFRPGVMDRHELGYEHLSKINPRLVYCSITAFGPRGPLAQKPGMDLIIQATAGLMGHTGEEGGPPIKSAPSRDSCKRSRLHPINCTLRRSFLLLPFCFHWPYWVFVLHGFQEPREFRL